MSGAKKQYLKI